MSTNKPLALEPHSIGLCVALHLIPGIINAATTIFAFYVIWHPELPPTLVFSGFVNVLVLIPVQLGFLFYLAKKRGNKRFSLEGIVIYNGRMTVRRYFIWVPAILIPTAAIFLTFQPVTDILREHLGFLDLIPTAAPGSQYAQPIVVLTLATGVLFTAFLVPITEELYFRGYLLPRMPLQFGKLGPAVHSFLFAVYHFDSPWMIPVRTLGLLPIIYVARHTGSVNPGIVTHCLVNAVEIMNVTEFRDG
jgi:membrane protease YdiL (CAAX protease family)